MNRLLTVAPWLALWALVIISVTLSMPPMPSVASPRSVALVLQAGDSAHCAGDALVQTGPLDVDCVAFTPTPTGTALPTDTPPPTPTDTPPATFTATFLPTVTSTATDTPQPTATDTATSTPLPTNTATNTPTALPRALWPLCPTHDPNAWHALDDPSRQCFYDHEHGDNPHLGDAIFGPPADAWGGQLISYPWATSGMENTHKHGGYKYVVRLNIPCGLNTNRDGLPTPNCITDARIEYHFVSHALDALARYHSYYLEFRVCQGYTNAGDPTKCGIMRIGGWADEGILELPYKGQHIVRPGATGLDFGMGSVFGGGNSEVVMDFAADDPQMANQSVQEEPYVSVGSTIDPLNGGHLMVWSMPNLGGDYGHNPWARFLIRTFDAWGQMNPANPNQLFFFCRDGSCADNGSKRALNEVSVLVPASWDTGGGFVNKSGYTNRFGQEVTGCVGNSVDCVPFSLTHVPTGAAHREDPQGGAPWAVEYDTSPSGQRKIEFPN